MLESLQGILGNSSLKYAYCVSAATELSVLTPPRFTPPEGGAGERGFGVVSFW